MSGTFAAVLAARLRRDGARPLVTFYDDATGERVELSVATYANWVAKTASLLQEELDVGRGGLVALALPTHWLGPVWLGAAWTVGAAVTDRPEARGHADVVVCGPEEVGTAAQGVPVVALSLRPMGARFAEPLPQGVLDYGVVVWGQPDAFLSADPPTAEDEAWLDGPTQADLLDEDPLVDAGGRLLTDVNPCSRAGLATLVGPLGAGGGTVWVRHPDPGRWSRHRDAEQATRELSGS